MNAIFIHSSFLGCRQTLPYAAGVTHYVDSEVGRLGTVLLHRPGPELARLTPRNNDSLLFDAIPWVGRAQEEHDAFAAALRERGVEVLYLATLLAETLAVADAAGRAHRAVLRRPPARRHAARPVADHLAYLDPAALADVLIAGLAHEELRISRAARRAGLHADGPARLRHRPAAQPAVHPRLVASGSATGSRVTSLAMPARRRETTLTDADLPPPPAVRRHRASLRARTWSTSRAGTCCCSRPGVLAVGVGERTTPAGAERLGPAGLRRRAGPHHPGGADRPGARDHAPGHRLHDGRRRRRA